MKPEQFDEAGQGRKAERRPGEGDLPSLEIEIDTRAASIQVQDPRFFHPGRCAAGTRLLKALCRQSGIRKAEIDFTSATCRVEFDLGHHAPQFMANAFVQAVRQASAGSGSEERTSWWRRTRRWTSLTAYRSRGDVVLWESDKARPGRIRHCHQGMSGEYARLIGLVDRVAALEGVQACHVSRWSGSITIDGLPGCRGADHVLDRVERILESWRGADSRQFELTSCVALLDTDGPEPITGGWRRIRYVALAGGAFTITLVALVVPGVPTVPFLLATSYYLARSSPRLNERLRRTAFFGPILREWEGQSGLSPTSKGRLIGLTATIVVVTVVLAPLTPLALSLILLLSSVSVLGVTRMPGLAEDAQTEVRGGQMSLMHSAL